MVELGGLSVGRPKIFQYKKKRRETKDLDPCKEGKRINKVGKVEKQTSVLGSYHLRKFLDNVQQWRTVFPVSSSI